MSDDNFNAAVEELSLSPQEQVLYRHHLYELGKGGVKNDDGSISTVRNITVEQDGRTFSIPTVWDGQVLSNPDAINRAFRAGSDTWPSYPSEHDAEKRYNAIHGYMEKDLPAVPLGPPMSLQSQEPQSVAFSKDAEDMLLDFNGWLGRQPDERRMPIQGLLDATPEAEREQQKQHVAAVFTIADARRADPGEVDANFDMARTQFSQEMGGDWQEAGKQSPAFYARLKKQAQFGKDERRLIFGPDSERDQGQMIAFPGEAAVGAADADRLAKQSLVGQAQEAAYAGKSFGDALATWQNMAKSAPGYDPARLAVHEGVAKEAFDREAAALAKVRPIANEVYTNLAKDRGRIEGQAPAEPAAPLRGLTAPEKELVFRLMKDKAEGAPDKGPGQALGEAIGRSYENFTTGASAADYRTRLLATHFNAGQKVTEGSPLAEVVADYGPEVAARLTAASGQDPHGAYEGALFARTRQRASGRPLTAEDAVKWNEQISAAIEDLDTSEQARKFAQDYVDPIKGGGWVRRHIVIPVAESSAFLTAFARPEVWGPALEMTAKSYQNEQYAKLRGEGMGIRQADKIAGVDGILLAARDKMAFGLLQKGMPGLSGALEKLSLAGRPVSRFALNYGVTLGADTVLLSTTNQGLPAAAQWTINQGIPAIVGDNLAHDPKFDVHWGEVWAQAARSMPDTALGLIIPAGFGALMHTRAQGEAARNLLSSPAAMRLRGYSMEDISRIQAAPEAMQGQLAAELLPTKAPTGEAQKTGIKDAIGLYGVEQQKAEAKLRAETAANTEAADYGVRVVRTGQGWHVERADGSTVAVSGPEAARAIREDLKQAATQQEADALVAITDHWHNKAGADTERKTTITGETVRGTQDAITHTRDGQIVREVKSGADLDAFHDEARMDAEASGNEDINKVVNGSNTLEFREKVADGAARVVQSLEVHQGESAPLTAIHEQVEAMWRTGIANGAITHEETARAIAGIAPAFDPAAARTPAEKAFRERVQRVAAGKATPAEVRETMSELAVAEVIGRRKDGEAMPAGSVSAALHAAIDNAKSAAEVKTLGKFRAFLRAVRQYFRGLFGTVAALKRAKGEGLGKDFRAMVEKLLGLDEQAGHADAAAAEAEAIAKEHLGEYVPPSAEEQAGGIAFSLSRAKPDDTSRLLDFADGTKLVGPTTFSITAHHGTPHKVDKFSLEKIGTGEGAQVYGWGLYFAEHPAVAEQYRNSLSSARWEVDGRPYDANDQRHFAGAEVFAAGGPELAIDTLQQEHQRLESRDTEWAAVRQGEIEQLIARIKSGDYPLIKEISEGNTYTVEVDVKPEELLDWDKPLSEQPERVRTALAGSDWYRYAEEQLDNGAMNPSGAQLYKWLLEDEAPAEASAKLLAAGIPGIQFLDGVSRSKREGTRNYVVFEDSKIRITHENGQPVSIDEALANKAGSSADAREAADQGGAAFSISPADRLELIAKRTEAQFDKDPEKRRAVGLEMARKLGGMAKDWSTMRYTGKGDEIRPLVEARTEKSLDKEQAFRQAARREELEAAVYANHDHVLSNPELAKLWTAGPVMETLSKPGEPLHGRLKSESEARKGTWFNDRVGDYDGADGIPRVVFGGDRMPDQMAQELYEAGHIKEPTADAMWEAIRKELASAQKWKEFLGVAKDELKQARQQAVKDGEAWREKQDAMQDKDHSPRASMVRDLRTLDAMLAVLPAEIRGKVGGFVKLAQLGTDKSRFDEIGRRIEKMGDLLEGHLKKENRAALDTLVKKAEPTGGKGEKQGGKITVEGHRVFDAVNAVRDLSETEAAARQTAIESEITAEMEKADPDVQKIVDLYEKRQLLEAFGNFDGKNAADGDAAVKFLTDVYTNGRNTWRSIVEQREQERADLRAQAIKEVGGPGTALERQKAREAEGKAGQRGWLADFFGRKHQSWGQRIASIFGVESKTANRYEKGVQDAFRAKAEALIRRRIEQRDMLLKLFGVKSWFKAQDELVKLQGRREKTGVMKLEGRKVETVSLPVDKAQDILEGSAQPDAYGLDNSHLGALRDALDRWAVTGDKSHSVEIEVVRNPGTPVEQMLSELEAIHLTMLARQEGYRAGMDFHGWTAESLEQMEKFISPSGKRVREWLGTQYEEGYSAMNRVYQSMYGIDLPKVENYAPGYFEHAGAPGDMNPFGLDNDPAGMAAGFLRKRKNHKAEPVIVDALQTYWNHVLMTEHWQAFAPIIQEMRSVFGAVETKHAITANEGAKAYGDVMNWVKIFEQNGIKDAQTNRWVGRVSTALARSGLAFKLGTWMKHFPNAFASLAEVPAGQFMRSFFRVITGQGEASLMEMWKSDTIRERLLMSFTPDLRQIMQGPNARAGWFAKIGNFLDWGVARISWVASALTTFSAAVAHDYHFREAVAGGMDEASARSYAEEKTAQTIARTAQPETLDRKSLAEIERTGAGRIMMLFHTPERQQWGVAFSALADAISGNGSKADAARKLASTWLIAPVLMQTMVGLFRYLTTDEDAEEAWTWKRYLGAIAMGPLSGIFGLGQIVEVGVHHFTGAEGSKASDAFTGMGEQMIKAGKHISDGDATFRDFLELCAAAGVLTGAASDVPAEGLKTLKGLYDQGHGLTTDKETLHDERHHHAH